MAARSAPDRKCYRQICPVARALDIVGDRWTLLILRELLGGSARFNHLLDGLPGIAKNLLTTRLRQLEEDGIVRRLSTDGAVLYALTELGASIRPVIEQLGFWGVRVPRLAPPEHGRSLRATAMALQSFIERAAEHFPEQPLTVELELDDGPIEFVLGPRPTVTATPSANADARVKAPTSAITDLLRGQPPDDELFTHLSGTPRWKKHPPASPPYDDRLKRTESIF